MLLVGVAQPYRSDWHDFIALASSFGLCGVFFCSSAVVPLLHGCGRGLQDLDGPARDGTSRL